MSNIDHYENFPVASWLCPAKLRPAVIALYNFARTADDIADEGTEPAHRRLEALGEYRTDLQNCLNAANANSTRWPHIFGPLQQITQQHQLTHSYLFDLLDAFEQDVIYTSAGQGYKHRADLLDYCRRSANPIGRLMLSLYGLDDPTSHQQSDAICTALQLINFWQDRAQDIQHGRDYLPHGHTLQDELIFARELMMKGAPLARRIRGRAGWELRTVVQGGLRILDKLDARTETTDHMLLDRPTLKKRDIPYILWRCIRM